MRFLEHLELEKKLGLASHATTILGIQTNDALPADPSYADLRTAEHCPTHRRKTNKSKIIRKNEANTLDVSKGRRSQFVVFEAQRYLHGRCGFFEGQSKMYFFGLFSLVYVSEYQARTRLRVRL